MSSHKHVRKVRLSQPTVLRGRHASPAQWRRPQVPQPSRRHRQSMLAVGAVLTLSAANVTTPELPTVAEPGQQDRAAAVTSSRPSTASRWADGRVSLLPTEPVVPDQPLAPPPALTGPLADLDPRVELSGIPSRVLEAYRAAADRLAVEQPGCALSWALLAGIGLVESGHGSFGGAMVATDGRVTPEIIGPRLDGAGPFAEIRDTDGGLHDRDVEYDRAVGPLQFLPGTWARSGGDADGDGRSDPHDIDDAALAAGRYLCAGGSLAEPAGAVRAVYSYNRSDDYVRLVLTSAAGYAGMTPESLGTGLLPPPAPAALPAPPVEPGAVAPVGSPAVASPAPESPAPGQVAGSTAPPSAPPPDRQPTGPEPVPAAAATRQPSPESTVEPNPGVEPPPGPAPTPVAPAEPGACPTQEPTTDPTVGPDPQAPPCEPSPGTEPTPDPGGTPLP